MLTRVLIVCLLLATVTACNSQPTAPKEPAAVDALQDDPNSPTVSNESNPDEIRRGMRMGGERGRNRQQIYFENIARKIEPDLKGDPERLAMYVDLYERETINDTRIFATGVQAEWNKKQKTVVLTGHVMFEENKATLEALLKTLKFEKIDNQIEVLPSADLGEKRFAFVNVSRIFAYDKTAPPRETLNEGLYGDPVFLLKDGDDNHVLCAMADGYIGYIDSAALSRVDAAAFTAYQDGPAISLTRDWTASIGGANLLLPQGTRLKVREKTADGYVAELPPGAAAPTLAVPAGLVVHHSADEDARAVMATQIAQQILGTDYVWGGKSSSGVDCSGLVQSAYQAQGIYLGRDASMQMYAGRLVATRWYRDGLKKGDLLYFLGRNGKVTHTAIYLGEGLYVEASGTVKLTSFDPADERYNQHRYEGFCFAKRLFEYSTIP